MHLNGSFGKEYSGIFIPCITNKVARWRQKVMHTKFKPAILNVTAGPGGINAINGVFGAYVDSLPMIVISGKPKLQLWFLLMRIIS